MAGVTQEAKPLVALGDQAGAALSDYRDGAYIHTITVVSAGPTDLDSIVIHDADSHEVIPTITVSGTTPFWRQVIVDGKFKGVHIQTNTGNRASVYVGRGHQGLNIGPVAI